MGKLKILVAAGLAGFALFGPKEAEVSISDKGGKQIAAIGFVPTGKPLPAGKINLFNGYWGVNGNAIMFLNVAKGIMLFLPKKETYFFKPVDEIEDGGITLDYNGAFDNDRVTIEKGGRISFANENTPDNKVFYEKIK